MTYTFTIRTHPSTELPKIIISEFGQEPGGEPGDPYQIMQGRTESSAVCAMLEALSAMLGAGEQQRKEVLAQMTVTP